MALIFRFTLSSSSAKSSAVSCSRGTGGSSLQRTKYRRLLRVTPIEANLDDACSRPQHHTAALLNKQTVFVQQLA